MFTHGVNRNLDPHLHSHVVVVNAVHGVDGRWSACDGRGLDAHRRAAGERLRGPSAGRADRVARGALGRADGPGRTAEIAGVSPAVLGEFSSRGADVRMPRVRDGPVGPGRHVAWAATRPPKVTGTPYDGAGGRLASSGRGGRDRRSSVDAGAGADAGVGRVGGSFDEHRFAGVIAVTPHGGAHRRDVVGGLRRGGPRRGAGRPSLERVTDLWAPAERVGVAEDLLSRRSVVPANHRLRALGPRPVDPADHETWLGGGAGDRGLSGAVGVERAPTAGHRPPFVAAAGPAGRPPAGDATARRGPHQLGPARAGGDGARAGPVTTRSAAEAQDPLDGVAVRSTGHQVAPRRALVGRRQGDFGDVLVRPEHERAPGSAPGHGVDGQREPGVTG